MHIKKEQRYISTMEPDLGLGIVCEVEAKRFTINFELAETYRQYSQFEAPVKRVLFRVGEKIKTRDDREYLIKEIQSKNSKIRYICNGIIIDEKDISPKLTFESPQQRLLAQMVDSTKDSDFRQKANIFKNRIVSSRVRGFVGGRVDLLPHQFYIAEKICNSKQKRFFLSDEVGLGKTIESCLVIHKLLITEVISRVLIVVPSALIHQWLIELFRRFNILSTLVNDDLKKRIDEEGEAIFKTASPIIVSIDEIQKEGAVKNGILASEWDLMVVDEAHHLAQGSLEYEIISNLSQKIDWLFLLTATPELMSEYGQFSLLKLIDPDKYRTIEKYRFEKKSYENIAKISDEILNGGNVNNILRISKLNLPPKILSEDLERREVISILNDLFGIGRSFFRNSRSVIKGFPKRKFLLENIDESLESWIRNFCLHNRDKKTLLICKSIDDATTFYNKLSKHKTLKVAFFTEEMSIIKLDRNAAWFSEKNGASVLVTSEIGSEGRNFQFADFLVMPNLPIEPEILEQRIGRLDRIGRTKPVKIVVPAKINSETDLLARWYNEGLNAFEHTLSGGYQTGEEFKKELLEITNGVYDVKNIDNLISLTKKYHKEIELTLKNGEHKLLEYLSFDRSSAEKITSEVEAVEQSAILENFMSSIFEQYQVEREELSSSITKITFDTVSDHAFPVPILNDDGILITFDRATALTREDSEFISIDHPIVTGSIDLILSSEKGNSSYGVLIDTGEDGFLLESVFIIEPTHNSNLIPSKYLPAYPARIVLNEDCENVAERFSNRLLAQKLSNGSIEEAFEIHSELSEFITDKVEKSRDIVSGIREKLVNKAITKVQNEYDNEISRIKEFSKINDDITSRITALKSEKTQLIEILKTTPVRLDSLRLIELR